jgi:hypothetical protein
MPEGDPLARLAADGLLQDGGPDGPRPTPRWRAAMARSALRLQRSGAPWRDLRLPIASALVELYPDLEDEEIARAVEAMLPIARRGLGPLFDTSDEGLPRGAGPASTGR